jgi:hypothetical protein
MTRKFLIAIAIGAAACSADATSGVTAGDLNGEWVYVRASNEPPGFFLDLMLAASGTSVSGTGTWQGEALPGGPATATGTQTGAHVVLDVTLTQTVTGNVSQEHFDMTFTSPGDLEGTKTVNGVASAVHLAKSNQ